MTLVFVFFLLKGYSFFIPSSTLQSTTFDYTSGGVKEVWEFILVGW